MEVLPVRLYLDLSKEPGERQVVYVRQGEREATVIEAVILDHGEPADLSGMTPYFTMRHPGGALLEDEAAQADGNVVTYVLPEQAAQECGTVEVAYFAFMADEAVSASTHVTTQAFAMVSLPNAQKDGGGVAEAYASRIEDMLRWCRDEFLAAEEVREERVQEAIDAADAATGRANDAADMVHSAVQGELGPMFGDYLRSVTDVEGGLLGYDNKDGPGGYVSYEWYTAHFLADPEFISAVLEET